MALFKRATQSGENHSGSRRVASTPIGEARPRESVVIEGRIEQMRARPTTGFPSLVITVADSTGSARVQWTGRRTLGGVKLGRRIAVHGVARMVGGKLEFTNPVYELLP